MKQPVKDIFLPFTQRFEGLCLFMYLDIEGLVTTGYGNLIDPHVPALLDWRTQDGLPVTAQEIRDEWNRVKALTRLSRMGGGIYRHYTRLRATQVSVDMYAAYVRDEMWGKLLTSFPDAEEWPADGQLGALSMMWACGENMWPKWPHLTKALHEGNWTVAAAECHIEDSHNPGVTPRNVANRALFMNAAQTCSPELLTYSV